MSKLILARHGNTFNKGETPTWVGAKTDLPLTEKGEEQGHAIAKLISNNYKEIQKIITGPLIRTKRFAEILSEKIDVDFSIDNRLCEIDYGLWENKSSNEIKEIYGNEIVDGWEKEGIWPDGMKWSPSKEKLLENIESLLNEHHQNIKNNNIIFTSNGILRFIYTYITKKPPSPMAKVAPGNYCILEKTNNGWEIIQWNEKP